MYAFATLNRVALLRVFLVAALSCAAYMGAAYFWRQELPRLPRWGFLIASMPWPYLTNIFVQSTIPLPLRIVFDTLVVSLGFGVNVTAVVLL
jgi:hypothetical protein